MDGAIRIIAEDLGDDNGSDFDYNDVVFDVKLVNEWRDDLHANKLVGYFVLRAAGGTLPLTVAGKEVHNLFGVATDVMVNTNRGTVSKAPVSFEVILGDADWNTPASTLVRNIPVIVQYKTGIITLYTETGQAPEKIAVNTSYVWCDEREPISTRYKLFAEWVKNKLISWY